MRGRIFLKCAATLPALLIVFLVAALLTGCAGRVPSLGKNPGADAGTFYAQGQKAQEESDYQAAEAAYRKAVRAGSPEASMALVALYDEGEIEGLSEKEHAKTVVKLASDSGKAGYVPAMVYLAELYKDGRYVEKNAAAATEWLTLAAENGDVPSMTLLAQGYRNLCDCGLICGCGEGCSAKAALWPVEKDMDKALYWLKRAAEKGNLWAICTLGDIYSIGIEAKLDYAEAVKWYSIAAEEGIGNVENNLANLYLVGQGVPKSYTKAAELYKRSSAHGGTVAKYNLAELMLYSPPPFRNYKEAVPVIMAAAKNGVSYSQTTLAEMYETGQGVKRNYSEAAKWYKAASDGDQAEAMVALGEMYRTGRGVSVDYELARDYFEKAVQRFNYWGYRGLGKLYANGQGVPRNEETARSYYLKGAESGDQEAAFLLAESLEHSGNVAEARRWYQAAADFTINQLPRGNYTRDFDTEPFAAKARAALQRLGE